MTDVVDRQTRSRMMSGIRGKDTKPELLVRKGLFNRGFRYRLHDKRLPGKPDLVFPKYSAVIFVHGCFWHGHDCHLFKWPTSRKEFWYRKIMRNREVDHRSLEALQQSGWRILVVWECALKGRARRPSTEVIDTTAKWILGRKRLGEITGKA